EAGDGEDDGQQALDRRVRQARASEVGARGPAGDGGEGGAAGSYLGSTRLPHAAIKRLLAVVLAIAGFKLIFA
ncbi:MAG: hypothetical protein NUW21_04910, partial [Elusimicrobia bacterium]|nr:hypothetical protein [Elusimicrobiota bacterium]